MTDSVANAAEFECLMKKRREARGDEQWPVPLGQPFECGDAGLPVVASEKRMVCELQKIAIGSARGYTECSDVALGFRGGRIVVYRLITLHLPPDEMAFWRKMIVKQITGKAGETGGITRGKYTHETCAFQGGCD